MEATCDERSIRDAKAGALYSESYMLYTRHKLPPECRKALAQQRARKLSRSLVAAKARREDLAMYPMQRLWRLPLDMWNKLPLRIDLPIPYLQIDIVFVNDPGQIKVECPLDDERTSDV